MKHTAAALSVVLAAALSAGAQDYSHGRIRHVEGGTSLQRASEAGSEEAFRNLPFLPGDRVWTDDTGRAEFQFAGGTIVRLGERSKLDYVEHEDTRGGTRVVLRLWSGALFVHAPDRHSAPDLEIETPAGLVEARGGVVARVDVDFGATRLLVDEGRASLDNGRRRVTAEAGEETAARPGADPERPEPARGRADDAFARWDSERERQIDWAADDARYVPEEVAPYAPDLANHGSWHFDVELGNVWAPYVAAGWRPYAAGRWVWSPYGWTWVPQETWGWAPFHYGRWGYSARLGWYWVPGRTWGPAWVSWSIGRDYVGWCPLGSGDRPLVVTDPRAVGSAIARGGQASPWTYARRGDLTAPDLARRRVEVPPAEAAQQRIVERTAHVDRELSVRDGERAVPRNVQTRPTPGDSVPELRADPMTTIPFPVPRRRYASEDERREREGRDRSRVRFDRGAPVERAAPDTTPDDADSGARRREGDAEVGSAPRGVAPFTWIPRTRASQEPAPRPSAESKRGDRDREPGADRTPERDVLRRMFAPLSESRTRDGGAGERGRTRDDDAARPRGRETPRDGASPRVERPQPSPQEGESGAVRRKKDSER